MTTSTLASTRAKILAESRSDHADWDVAFNEAYSTPPLLRRRRRGRRHARRNGNGNSRSSSSGKRDARSNNDDEHPLLRLAERIAAARALGVPLDDILPEIALRQGLWISYDARLHPRRRVPTVPASLWSTPRAMVSAAAVLARLDQHLHEILFAPENETYMPRENLPADILVATARYRAVLRARGHFVGWAPLNTGVPQSFLMTHRVIADATAALPDWIYAHFRTYGPTATFAATDGSRVIIRTDEPYTSQEAWFSTAAVAEPSVPRAHADRVDALWAKAVATRVPIRYSDRTPSPLSPRAWRRPERLGTNYLTDSLARRHDRARDKGASWNSLHRSVVERFWARSHFPTQAVWEWELDGATWDPKIDWFRSHRAHRVPTHDVYMFHGWWEQARRYRFVTDYDDGEEGPTPMDIDANPELRDWSDDDYHGDDEGPMDIDVDLTDGGSTSGTEDSMSLEDDEPLPYDAPPPPTPAPTRLLAPLAIRRLPSPLVIVSPPSSVFADVSEPASPTSASTASSSPTSPSPPHTPSDPDTPAWAHLAALPCAAAQCGTAIPGDDPSLVPALITAASSLTHAHQGDGTVLMTSTTSEI